MTIHYSPYFDGETYIDFESREAKIILNELFVGNAGLLAELELRGGLTRKCLSPAEREANYYNMVKRYVESQPDCIISASFEKDEYGVASELLRWRDDLILSGWNTKIEPISDKLSLLSAIEKSIENKDVDLIGESDRWRLIFDSEQIMLEDTDELRIHFRKDLLPSYFTSFFDKMEACGMKICYQTTSEPIAEQNTNLNKLQRTLLNHSVNVLDKNDNSSFRLFRFDDQANAYEWLIGESFSENTVFVNADNKSFDNVQQLFGTPLSGSQLSNANPEIVQLFKLGCSLLLQPFNVYNLLSYLQIKIHPLPLILRRQLIDVIISEGGIVNQEWNDVIKEYVNPEDKTKTKKHKEKLIFLPVDKILSSGINKQALTDYVKALYTWASQSRVFYGKKKDLDNLDLILQQFSIIGDFCNALLLILKEQTIEIIPTESFKSWMLSIYQPSNYSYTHAQNGSRLIINSPGGIMDAAKQVVWIDCNNGTPSAKKYTFLNKKEYKALEEVGLKLWSEESQVKAELYAHKIAVIQCKEQLTLIVSEKEMGERLNTHPLISQLATQFDNLCEFEKKNPLPSIAVKTIEFQQLPAVQLDCTVNPNLFTARTTESYSSLSNLIQYPLDYVLQYQAKLRANSVVEMADEQRTKGNVAHLLIETLVDSTSGNIEEMKRHITTQFDEFFSQAVMQKGAILLLGENKIGLTVFKEYLRQSTRNLIDLIIENNLTIIGCEVVRECNITDQLLMEARIDMLLKNKNGDYVVFDMKWTSSNTFYKKLLTENRALQLEVYKQVLKLAEPTIKVAAVGYFILSRGVLETTDNFIGKHVAAISMPLNNNDIFDEAMVAYRYRWEQLNRGEIEMAEGMPLEVIRYVNDTETRGLYQLDTDYNNKKLKGSNGFSNYRTFKGGLK